MRITLRWETHRGLGMLKNVDEGVSFKNRVGFFRPVTMHQEVILDVPNSLSLRWKRKVERMLHTKGQFRKDVKALIKVDCPANPLKDIGFNEGCHVSARDAKEFSNRLCNIIAAQKRERVGTVTVNHKNTEAVIASLVSGHKTATKKTPSKKRKLKKAKL